MKIQAGDEVLLLGRKSYLVKVGERKFHCEFGTVDLSSLVGAEYGTRVRTHLGEEFVAVRPWFPDLVKKFRRAPQVVLPKDASLILAVTGAGRDTVVVDAGAGSGFLAIFLGRYVKKVSTYERRKDFYEIASENVRKAGLGNVSVIHGDVRDCDVSADLVTLDLSEPESVLPRVREILTPGGWVTVFSPFVEQVGKVVEKLRELSFAGVRTYENILREWGVEIGSKGPSSRPKPYVLHTGFLTFGRKTG